MKPSSEEDGFTIYCNTGVYGVLLTPIYRRSTPVIGYKVSRKRIILVVAFSGSI